MDETILGVKISNISKKELTEKFHAFCADDFQHYVTTPNPEMIVLAKKNNEFRNILNLSDISVPDGVGIIFAAKLLGKKLQERITGVDLVWHMAELSEDTGYPIYFFGGQQGVAETAALKLKRIYPKMEIAGYDSGGIIKDPKNIDTLILKKINSSKAKILIVALGQMKQEQFIYYNLDKIKNVKLAMGVGGALDYISGNVKRAPEWIQNIGFEWLYRLISQPWRFERILQAVFIFPLLTLREKFKI